MKRYKAKFYGRRKGSQGAFYWIETNTKGETLEQAELALYERFEHLHHLTMKEHEVQQ